MTRDESSHETEFKLALPDAGAHRAIAARAGWEGPLPEAARQENHFFDADGRLASGGYALRVRDEDGRFFLTAKGPSEGEGDGLTVKPEEELELDEERARAFLSGASSPLGPLRGTALGEQLASALGDAPLMHIGSFVNERTRVAVALSLPGGPLDVVLELDRTRLPGGRIDHELEVEVPEARADEVRARLRDWLAAEGIEWTPSSSKLGRFRAALG